MNKRTSFNLSEATRHKLEALTKVYSTRTEIVALGIDRLYAEAVQSGLLTEQAEDCQEQREEA